MANTSSMLEGHWEGVVGRAIPPSRAGVLKGRQNKYFTRIKIYVLNEF